MSEYGGWFEILSDREKALVRHAVSYYKEYSDAGAPGHNQFMLIANLAFMLNASGADELVLAPIEEKE